MKINIVLDQNGTIIGGSEISDDPKIVSCTPILKEGQTIKVVEAPNDTFEKLDEMCEEWEKKAK